MILETFNQNSDNTVDLITLANGSDIEELKTNLCFELRGFFIKTIYKYTNLPKENLIWRDYCERLEEDINWLLMEFFKVNTILFDNNRKIIAVFLWNGADYLISALFTYLHLDKEIANIIYRDVLKLMKNNRKLLLRSKIGWDLSNHVVSFLSLI